MKLLNLETLTVTRYAAGAYGSDGVYVPGSTTTLTVQATVQPLNGKDLQILPEGLRTREAFKLYTATELRTTDQTAGTLSDIVTRGGALYDVQQVGPWLSGSGTLNHHKAIIVRRQENG